LISLLLFISGAFSQQTNSKEDYSAYLPQVRSVNNYIAHMPEGGSLLTKEGLAAARKEMTIAPVNPEPAVKYIPGPGGNLALRIFKPDTIRAVVLSIH